MGDNTIKAMLCALLDMASEGEEINMYVPTPSDVAWAKNFLPMFHDGGVWGVPRLGIYKINHTDKTLTLVEQWGPDSYFDMDVAVFEMVGYKVRKRPTKLVDVEVLN